LQTTRGRGGAAAWGISVRSCGLACEQFLLLGPRIVAGLIDRPELTDPKGSRREMTILFCDMKDFTTLVIST
jgi:hypothetical protein